jgi:hypothetical protein
MRVRQLARTLAVAGLTTHLLAACGSPSGSTSGAAASSSPVSSSSAPATPAGNGEAAKTGPQVASDAADALASASAVHMVGTGVSDGQPLSLDLHLQGSDVSGTVTMGGQPVDILSTGGKTYIKATAAFWKTQQLPASIAKKLDGTWVIVPAEAGSPFEEFSQAKLADQLRKPDSSTWQPAVTKGSYQGRDVVVITESDGSTTQVAATGKPYPLHADDKGSEPSTVTFGDYGTAVPITAPPSALDLTKLGG